MDLDHHDILRILGIIHEAQYTDFRLSVGNFKLHMQAPVNAERGEASPTPKWNSQVDIQPALAALTSRTVSSDRSKEYAAVPDGAVALCAPMLGVLRRAGDFDASPLVEVGDSVNAGDTVCFIRVLKELTPIKAGILGTIAQFAVENSTLVEYEQVLMWVKPERSM